MTLGEWALWYYDQGLTVFPLPPGSKKATMAWGGFQKERPTREHVISWWEAEPEANIAIVTGALSGVVVVDVDPGHGGDVSPFQAASGDGSAVARTRAGGWHIYHRHPGHPVKSVAGPSAAHPGVDVRGDGGYVVAPPSRVDPGEYTWEMPFDRGALRHFDEAERMLSAKQAGKPSESPAERPDWVAALLATPVAIGGQRQALTRLAGYFSSKGLPPDVILATLAPLTLTWRQDRTRPWRAAEISSLVHSICDKDAAGREAARRGVEPGPEPMRVVEFDTFMRLHEGKAESWLVEDWLPLATIAMAVSPPGGFKTWLLAEMALSVALGHPFLGRYPVHTPGPVLFIQQEDPETLLADRLGPLCLSKVEQEAGEWLVKPEHTPIFMATDGGFRFDDKAQCGALVARLKAIKPRLVIMDPLYSMASADKFFADMAANFLWLKRLRREHGCAFLIAHHTKKPQPEQAEGREQMWGSNLMNAAIETGWQIRQAGEKATTIQRHFKVSGTITKKKFKYDIDITRIPAMIVEEADLDLAVEESELGSLDSDHELILATLRQEGKAMATAALARAVGRPLTTVQRKVGDLMGKGLLVKDNEKRLRITTIDPKEVS